MKGRKFNTILIIINFILLVIVYNLLNRINVDDKKQIIKEMSEVEYEDSITVLNESHEEYANHIDESKKRIAVAITDMGIKTAETANAETMANNIRNISTNKDASSISYDNTKSELDATNVQGAVDEINSEIEQLNNKISIIPVSVTKYTHSGGWSSAVPVYTATEDCYVDLNVTVDFPAVASSNSIRCLNLNEPTKVLSKVTAGTVADQVTSLNVSGACELKKNQSMYIMFYGAGELDIRVNGLKIIK